MDKTSFSITSALSEPDPPTGNNKLSTPNEETDQMPDCCLTRLCDACGSRIQGGNQNNVIFGETPNFPPFGVR